jgi:hypothetical protein
MKIDNAITIDRVKKALTPKTVAVVLIIVSLLSLVFYVTVDRQKSREMLIWFITTETHEPISSDVLAEINKYGNENGIDKILLTRRHPEDRYFDVIMSTTAFYSCDVFIMTEEVARKYSEMDMFLPLDYGAGTDEILTIDGETVGLHLDGDYYLFINSESDFDTEILYDIFDMMRTK